MTRLTRIQILVYNLDPRTAPGGTASLAPAVALQHLKNLTGQDFGGAEPMGALLADANGNLFGTTKSGGTGDAATVLALTRTGFVP
jgi:hypothetical protein